jgi:ribosomal protein S18 acetylase RimI-like enzyme
MPRARLTTEVQVRRGTVADAAALAAFAACTFAETFSVDNRAEDLHAYLASAYGVAQQTRELADPEVVTLLAHRGPVLVAYAQVRRKAPPPCVTHAQPIELHRFYVDRTLHGSGVAQTLMRAVHGAAAAFDGRHLWLGVWERNHRALAFYAKQGFVTVGSTGFQLGADMQTDRVCVAALMAAS